MFDSSPQLSGCISVTMDVKQKQKKQITGVKYINFLGVDEGGGGAVLQ